MSSKLFTDEDKSTLERLIRQAQIQPEPTGPNFGPAPNWWRTQGVQGQQKPSSQMGDEWTEEGIVSKVEKEKREQMENIERKKMEQAEKMDSTLDALLKYLPALAQLGAVGTSTMQGNVPQTLYYLRKLAQSADVSQAEKREISKLQNEIKRLKTDLEKTEKERKNRSQSPAAPKRGKKRGKGVTKKANPWLDHCKQVQKDNPELKWGEVLKKAKTSYKK